MTNEDNQTETAPLTDEEKRANVIRLAFGGSEEKLADFLRVIREEIPDGTGVILRGSSVTGQRWRDQAAFDEVLVHTHPMTLAWDRIHPNMTGHLVLARAFLRTLDAL